MGLPNNRCDEYASYELGIVLASRQNSPVLRDGFSLIP